MPILTRLKEHLDENKVAYEVQNRPDWVDLPLRSLLQDASR